MILGRFMDGPLEGRSLTFERAPVFLRATINAGGEPDVLDQLDDEPHDEETIHLYTRGEATGFACGRGQGASRQLVEYFHLPFIDGERFREREVWQDWTSAVAEAAMRVSGGAWIPLADLIAVAREHEEPLS